VPRSPPPAIEAIHLNLSVDARRGAAFPESKWFDRSGAVWMGSALSGDQ
jgi:hypothetical protein